MDWINSLKYGMSEEFRFIKNFSSEEVDSFYEAIKGKISPPIVRKSY